MKGYVIIRLLLLLLLLGSPAATAQAEEILKLGIYAYRPHHIMQESYQPLADYLSARLHGVRVVLHVLELDEIDQALARRELDLVMTNPVHYLQIRVQSHLTGALATVISIEDGLPTASLGGVIVTRAQRTDINGLTDLKGRRIAIPGTSLLGGYLTQVLELAEAGVEVPGGDRLVITGRHDNVIEAVLSGDADAGFVRTGIVEGLVAAGQLDQSRLKIINRQQLAGFPFIVSTRLYPEWPFVALPSVDRRLTQQITTALFELDAHHPASRAAGIAGFTPPADYQPVEHLARTLRVPPYDMAPEFTLGDILRKHSHVLIVGLSGGLLVAVLVTMLFLRNRKLVQLSLVLQQRTQDLAGSNAELEQFAYVASHDLRQPLRMISGYLKLLERKLDGHLDDSTREMMNYAVDGAVRMDQMLLSLLEYSRVGRAGEPAADIDSRTLVDEALRFLATDIREVKAQIAIEGDWPVIRVSCDEFVRLWQNLISNALKYRDTQNPCRVVINCEKMKDGLQFSVADNGIGIDPQQFGRIFKVFQRLHTQDQYEGNGVGLAIVRKIVERHGGQIRVYSEGVGTGSRFSFTLPAGEQ